MRTAFHYTYPEGWEAISTGKDGKTGLDPRLKMLYHGFSSEVPGLPEWAYREFLSCLLEERPKGWAESRDFPYLWKALVDELSRGSDELVLVQFDILPTDEAYVTDWAPLERAIRSGNRDNEAVHEAWRQLDASKMRALEYDGRYSGSLEILLVGNHVDLKRLRARPVRADRVIGEA